MNNELIAYKPPSQKIWLLFFSSILVFVYSIRNSNQTFDTNMCMLL